MADNTAAALTLIGLRFSESTDLNVVMSDLAKGGISLDWSTGGIIPIPMISRIIPLAKPIAEGTITIQLDKTRPLARTYFDRWVNNAILNNEILELDSVSPAFQDVQVYGVGIERVTGFAEGENTDLTTTVTLLVYKLVNTEVFNGTLE